MQSQSIQKGSLVYIVPEDTRHEPYNCRVLSVGSKYITVEGKDKFDIRTLYSVEDSRGWNPRLQLYKSKEYFERKKQEDELKGDIISYIEKHLGDMPMRVLRDISELVKQSLTIKNISSNV